jgi:hypothetical protein
VGLNREGAERDANLEDGPGGGRQPFGTDRGPGPVRAASEQPRLDGA